VLLGGLSSAVNLKLTAHSGMVRIVTSHFSMCNFVSLCQFSLFWICTLDFVTHNIHGHSTYCYFVIFLTSDDYTIAFWLQSYTPIPLCVLELCAQGCPFCTIKNDLHNSYLFAICQLLFRRDFYWCPTFSKLKKLLLNDWCVVVDMGALVCILKHSLVLEKLTLQLRKVCSLN
jgi:hypothetical protein